MPPAAVPPEPRARRGMVSEARSRKPEAGSRKPEAGSRKPEAGVCVEKVPISQVSEKLKKKILNRLGAWKIEAVLENQYRKWGFHQNLAKSVFDESGKVEKK